ncbi:dCMP deaminase [Aureococcus anophagefferens]|nr:dCMP deaminase [Aureococcus anophagefferens]
MDACKRPSEVSEASPTSRPAASSRKRPRDDGAPPAPKPFLGRVKEICAKCTDDSQRLGWDEYFASMALLASARSPCDRLHVGCVIVRDRRVLAMGYNGFFRNAPHTSIMAPRPRAGDGPRRVNAPCPHAARTGIALDGASAYITYYPCVNCFKTLVSAGIKEVRYIDDAANDPQRPASDVAGTCSVVRPEMHRAGVVVEDAQRRTCSSCAFVPASSERGVALLS